mgnify:CR=1 FL=1
MTQEDTKSQFSAKLARPKNLGDAGEWAFVVLPQKVSAKLPRRGRTSVDVSLNGHRFQALLEPDGRKSHWLKIEEQHLRSAGTKFGETVQLEISAVEQEPEPQIPGDLLDVLQAAPEALQTWKATTTIARIDWIHWITSAKQAKTRTKRIADACSMLTSGKKRVCCFDTSGFYSKAFSAPQAADNQQE